MTECEIRFDDREVYRPDIAGWLRERMPAPQGAPHRALPRLGSARILSPSNERNDIVKKMLTYQRARVPHYWVIDPLGEALVVYRWTPGGLPWWLQSAQGGERVRAEPFDGVWFR
jgi:hypothetical protein